MHMSMNGADVIEIKSDEVVVIVAVGCSFVRISGTPALWAAIR